jgi:hypothetical protein
VAVKGGKGDDRIGETVWDETAGKFGQYKYWKQDTANKRLNRQAAGTEFVN